MNLVDLPLAGFRVVHDCAQLKCVQEKHSKSREACERNESSQNSKDANIGDICEELIAVHVVASCKNDRREDEVEKQVIVERHDFGELCCALSTRVDARYEDANNDDEASFVAKPPMILVLEGLVKHENHEHHKDYNNAFVEDLMLLVARGIRVTTHCYYSKYLLSCSSKLL